MSEFRIPAKHMALSTIASFAMAIALVSQLTFAAPPADIEVMILGTYHMDNPGRDVVNSKIDDVTTPSKQAQLADVANRLAAFRPTKIAIEVSPEGESNTVPAYRLFKPEMLLSNKNEIAQIGYRLAYQMKHAEVYAIDEKSKTIDYFPFGKLQEYAKATGRSAELMGLVSGAQAFAKELEKRQATETVGQLLAMMNDANTIRSTQHLYAGLLGFGSRDDDKWPGAELNAAWYLRNAKIFAKLTRIVEPGDRVVVLFGTGHSYQLREFVSSSKGYRLIEPNTFLLP